MTATETKTLKPSGPSMSRHIVFYAWVVGFCLWTATAGALALV